MKKQLIGFDRALTLDWLDVVAGLTIEKENLTQIRAELLNYLQKQVSGKYAIKNTGIVLTRIWSRIPPSQQALQQEALQLLPHVLAPERLWLHWGMTLVAYPFFRDVVSNMGYMLTVQEYATLAQIQRRMTELWGDRSTVKRATRRIIQSLLNWGVINKHKTIAATYLATSLQHTTNKPLVLWFLECVLRSYKEEGGSVGQLPLSKLIKSNATFPFELIDHSSTLQTSSRFEILRPSGGIEMVALGEK